MMIGKVEYVEIWIKNLGTGDYVPCWVTKQEALITHSPGLIPPPGHRQQ